MPKSLSELIAEGRENNKSIPDKDNKSLIPERYSGIYKSGYEETGINKYDSGIPLVNIARERQINQGFGDELANGLAKATLKLIPSVLSNIASLGDIANFHETDDEVGNSLKEYADQTKQNIENEFPIYGSEDFYSREGIVNNLSGLAESAGAFAISGTGTGLAIGKGVSLLSNALKATDTGKKLLGAVGIIGNTYLMNHMEGEDIAKDTYNQAKELSYNKYINQGLDHYEADKLSHKDAKQAMDYAYNINRGNMLLNLTSAGAFLRTPNLTRQILTKETTKRALARTFGEGVQEATEETINDVAQNEGLRLAEQGKNYNYNFANTLNDTFSEKGFQTALLGFVGGAAQTGLTEVANRLTGKTKEENEKYDEQQKAIKNLENLSGNRFKIKDLLNNTYNSVRLQNDIQNSVLEGDDSKANALRDKTLANAAFNAFKTGTTNQLENIFSIIEKDPESDKLYGEDSKKRAVEAKAKILEFEKIYNNTVVNDKVKHEELFNNYIDYNELVKQHLEVTNEISNLESNIKNQKELGQLTDEDIKKLPEYQKLENNKKELMNIKFKLFDNLKQKTIIYNSKSPLKSDLEKDIENKAKEKKVKEESQKTKQNKEDLEKSTEDIINNTRNDTNDSEPFYGKFDVAPHGRTESDDKNVLGTKDESLNEEGVKDAQKLGKTVEKDDDTEIASSDLPRAQETADIVQNKTNLEREINPELRAWDLGVHEDGKTNKDDITKKFTDNPDEVPEGGESFNQFKNRIKNVAIHYAALPEKPLLTTHSSVHKFLEAWKATNYKEDEKGTPIIDNQVFFSTESERGEKTSFDIKEYLNSKKPEITDEEQNQLDSNQQLIKPTFEESIPNEEPTKLGIIPEIKEKPIKLSIIPEIKEEPIKLSIIPEIKEEPTTTPTGVLDKDSMVLGIQFTGTSDDPFGVLDPHKYNVGEELILEVDRDFNKNGFTYESLLKKGEKEGRPHAYIPIAIKNKNGVIIGYVTFMDVAEKNDKLNNKKTQLAVLNSLREKIFKEGKHSTKVSLKTSRIDKSSFGDSRLLTEIIPNSDEDTIQLAIVKGGKLVINSANEEVQSSKEFNGKIVDSKGNPLENFNWEDGTSVIIVPNGVEGQYFALPNTDVLINEEQIETIYQTIKATLIRDDKSNKIKNDIANKTNLNIYTANGLKSFIQRFIHLSIKNDLKRTYIDYNENNNTFTIKPKNSKDEIVITANNINQLENIIKSSLRDVYNRVSLENLTNPNYSLVSIKNGEVTSETVDYNKYIRTKLLNDVKTVVSPEGRVFFVNHPKVNIYFDQLTVIQPKDNPPLQKGNKEIKNPLKGNLKNIDTSKNTFYSPSEVEDNEVEDSTINLQDYFVEGLSLEIHLEVINSFASAINDVLSDNNVKNEEKEEKIKKLKEQIKLYLEEIPDKDFVLATINENFEKLWKLSEIKISQLINLRFNTEAFDSEGFSEVESLLSKTNFADDASDSIDFRETISSRLRRFFAFIPDVETINEDTTYNEKIGVTGLVTFKSIDEVINQIQSLLQNKKPDYDSLISELRKNINENKWLASFINILENSEDKIKNEFVVFVTKTASNSVFIDEHGKIIDYSKEDENNSKDTNLSFRDVKGNNVFSNVMGKLFTDVVNDLTSNFNNKINSLLGISFSKTSTWLKQLNSNPYFQKTFNYFTFDGRKSGNLGKKTKDIGTYGHELSKLQLFVNRFTTNGSNRVAKFLSLTMSDSGRAFGIQALAENVIYIDGELSDDIINKVSQIAFAEWTRIKNYKKSGSKISGYEPGLFYTFPELQNSGVLDADELTPEVQQIIKKVVKAELDRAIDSKIKDWDKLGIDIKSLNRKYLEYILGNSEDRTNKELNKKLVAADYVVNYYLANANQLQLIFGDPALFYKKGSLENTFINMGKRFKSLVSPRLSLANSTYEKYNVIYVEDNEKIRSATYDYLKEILGEEGAKDYLKINPTDAQEFITIEEKLKVLYGQGKISKKEYDRLLSNKNNLDLKDLKIVLGVDKPLYSGFKTQDDVNKLTYIKSSSFVLIPQITKGLNIDFVRQAMEESNIGRMVFTSAAKTGAENVIKDLIDDKGNFKVDNLQEKFKKHSVTLDRISFGIQQDLPFDPEKDSVVKGSQETLLLFEGLEEVEGFQYKGSEYKGEDLEKEYIALHKEIYAEAREKLEKELNFKKSNNLITFDIKKLAEILVAEGLSRGWSFNDIASLNVIDYNGLTQFEMPLFFNNNLKKIEAVLNNIVDSRVRKQKMSGFSAPLVSETGFIGKSVKNSIIFVEGYNSEEGLKGVREEEGIIKPAQVILSSPFIDELHNFYVVQNKVPIPKEFLQMIGSRIPNQGLNSKSYVEVVGYIPHNLMGDLVIAPKDFTKQMGSDFDVDKLFIYHYDLEKTDEGFKKVLSPKNDVVSINISILSNPSKIVQKKALSVTSSDKLKNIANDINNRRQARLEKNNFSILNPDYQRNKFLSGSTAKKSVAIKAIDRILVAIFTNKNITLAEPIYLDGKVLKDLSKGNYEAASENLSAALDNEKEQIVEKINSNEITYDAERTLLVLGLEDISPYFISQDILFEFVEEVKNLIDKGFNKKEAFKEAEKNITNNYRKLANLPENYKFNPDYNFSKEELNEMITKGGDKFPIMQINVLQKFIQLSQIGLELGKIAKTLNTYSTGLKPSLLDNIKLEEDFKSVKSDIIKNINNLFTETIQAIAIENSLLFNNDLLGNLLNYNSDFISNILKEIRVISGRELTSKEKQDVINNLKALFYSSKNIGIYKENSVIEERKRLLVDSENNKSLGTRIEELQKTKNYGKINSFISRLKIIKKDNGNTYILMTKGVSNSLDLNSIYLGFIDLFKNEETKDIAEDLVRYHFITGGQNNNVSLSNFIPYSYLRQKGIINYLNSVNLNDNQPGIRGLFISQYIKNNPHIPQNVNIENVKIINSNRILYKSQLTPKFITITKKEGEVELYKLDDAESGFYTKESYYTDPYILQYDLNSKIIVASEKKISSIHKNDLNNELFEEKLLLDKEGNITLETLKTIALTAKENNGNINQIELLNWFIELNKNTNNKFNIKLKIDGDADYQGKFDFDSNTITMNNDPNKNLSGFVNTFIHEYIHALTSKLLIFYETDKSKLNTNQIEYIKNLHNLLDNVRNKFTKIYGEEYTNFLKNYKPTDILDNDKKKIWYSTLNIHEFTQGVLNNSKLQKELNSIPYDSNKSLLDRVKQLISKLIKSFNLNSNTVLEEGIINVLNLVESNNLLELNIITENDVNNAKFCG